MEHVIVLGRERCKGLHKVDPMLRVCIGSGGIRVGKSKCWVLIWQTEWRRGEGRWGGGKTVADGGNERKKCGFERHREYERFEYEETKGLKK
jgi:hypothetical protein